MKLFDFITKSIATKLLVLFILVSAIPLTFSGIMMIRDSRRVNMEEALIKLEAIGTIKKNQITDYFKDLSGKLHAIKDNPTVQKRLEEFDKAFVEAGDTVDCDKWKKLANRYDPFFKDIVDDFDIDDIILMCPEFSIVYTLKKDNDLGRFLTEDSELQNSPFGEAYRSLINSKQEIALGDMGIYTLINNKPAIFMIAKIKNNKGELAGHVAFRLSLDGLDHIMMEATGLGKTGETYLVGEDFLMRSDSRFDKESTILKREVRTDATIHLFTEHHDYDETEIIKDYRGVSVLSYHSLLGLNEIMKTDFDWAIVAEIDTEEAFASANKLTRKFLFIGISLIILVIIIASFSANAISKPIKSLTKTARLIALGDLKRSIKINLKDEIGTLANSFKDLQKNMLTIADQAKTVSSGDYNAEIKPRSEKDELSIALNDMTKSLRQTSQENELQNWFKTGQNKLNEKMRGDQDVISLSKSIITFLAKYVNAQIGALYLVEEESDELKLSGSYAFSVRKNLNTKIKFGEGLVGQSAYEKEMITLANVPDDYIRVNSSLGDAIPKNILVAPFIFEGSVLGVIELGSIKVFSEIEMEFIRSAMENIGIAVNSSISRVKLKVLLEKTQLQSEELQTQQEELRAANEELEEQTEELKASTEKLKTQQEELQATNEELEEKTESLEKQKTEIMEQNRQIEVSRKDVEKKAEDLAIASKYKSEFLANMSHELRTPLNSLLILSRDLADNNKGNLLDKQVESAEIIYGSGNDLLNLINEILDLSKIEAGKMTLNIQKVMLTDLDRSIKTNFQHQMKEKGLELKVHIAEDLNESIITDQQRIEQVIKNLLSNAIKFTEQGSITVDFKLPDPEIDLSKSRLEHHDSIAISVTDTGIGIPEDKLIAIFEAFQQADGSTSRKFGGTGLGLSISRELSKLLGGELQLKSKEGKGSTFTIIIPEILKEADTGDIIDRRKNPDRRAKRVIPKIIERKDNKPAPSIDDDRKNITKKDRKILVIEDDLNFAKTLRSFCREKHFKFIHSGDGETGLKLAEKYIPDAIILDIKLPGMDGWVVLDVLKENPHLRHIPVHMMSALEETIDAFQKGAIGYLTKPISKDQLEKAFKTMESFYAKDIKDLLIVEDDETMRKTIVNLLGEDNINITSIGYGKKALEKIKKEKFDCIVLDLILPDISGFEVLKELEKADDVTIPPVIIYTGKDITKEEEFELNKYTNSIIIKGVKSEERLLDETALFLHQVVDEMPKNKQKIISRIYDKDALFEGKRVLVVDDDMRNVFAVSHILEEKGMVTVSAANGKNALEILDKEDPFDLILMDIMMPVMDGYETMKRIRKQKTFKDILIIALTAKAMKGDKEQCLAAGANDYLAKPLQIDRLLSMMRVWMYK